MAALQPALRKLEALLNGKLMLLKGVRSDITFLKSELEALDAFLVQMSLVDDHRMIKLQELSNSIQESIDELELRFDDERLGNFKGFTKRSMSLLPLAKIRHPDSLMILVKEVAEQHARDGIAAGISNHGNSAVDPQVCSINNDVSDLVGMDGPRDELTKWLLEEEDALGQRLKMVCIVGDRGLGKTTLAEQLRHTLREYPRCQAFVLVSRTPDMVKILRTILCQVTGQSYANTEAAGDDQQHLIDKISKFLTDKRTVGKYPTVCVSEIGKLFLESSFPFFKSWIYRIILTFRIYGRYLVIIDDIPSKEAWGIIKTAFPENNLGSRIIMTARVNDVAKACCSGDDGLVYEIKPLTHPDSKSLFLRRLFSSEDRCPPQLLELCDAVLGRCYGVPLEIISMASLLAYKPQTRESWKMVTSVLHCAHLDVQQILSLAYRCLPPHLKTCWLYLSTYPDYHKIEMDDLVRKWIAEEFIVEERGHSLEEAAKNCLDELVKRGFIQTVGGCKNEVRICPVHRMMLGILRSISQEGQFVHSLPNYDASTSDPRCVSWLSIHPECSVDASRMEISHTRSLAVFGDARRVPFKHFEHLRLLDLEGSDTLENAHLVDICGLLWLRYLGLKNTQVSRLPRQIRKLQYLETLDVRNTGVRELPREVGLLTKLVYLLAGDMNSHEGAKLPDGAWHFNSVQVLSIIDLTGRLARAVKQLGQMRKLRELAIALPYYEPADRMLNLLDSCSHLKTVLIYGCLTLSTERPSFRHRLLGGLKVARRYLHVPQWIKQHFSELSSLDIRIFKLEKHDLKLLQEMYNLQSLVIRFEVLPRKAIPISGEEGFARLESFCVDSRVPRVTFGPGAMPNLKHLTFKFYAGPASEDPVGITHLRSLEKVIFRCSPWYNSNSPGISATVAVVRREAEEHPNRITLCINDKEEIFLEKLESAQVCRGENRDAGSSGTSGIEAEEDMLPADRNSLAGNDRKKEIFHDNSYAIASCSRTSEIEEVEAQ